MVYVGWQFRISRPTSDVRRSLAAVNVANTRVLPVVRRAGNGTGLSEVRSAPWPGDRGVCGAKAPEQATRRDGWSVLGFELLSEGDDFGWGGDTAGEFGDEVVVTSDVERPEVHVGGHEPPAVVRPEQIGTAPVAQ